MKPPRPRFKEYCPRHEWDDWKCCRCCPEVKLALRMLDNQLRIHFYRLGYRYKNPPPAVLRTDAA